MVWASMRIVLLLTLGLPVIASQLVAIAAPRIQPVICTSASQVVTEASADDARAVRVVRLQAAAPVVAWAQVDEGVEAPRPAPEGASARALTFVKHAYAQAT